MKRKSILLILLSFSILQLLTSCSHPELTSEVPARASASSPTNSETKALNISDLDPAVQKTLRIYPLHMGSSWFYEYLGYDATQEVIWRVTETIVDVRIVEGYYVATMERSAELLDGDPPADFIHTPDTGVFWYLIDGDKIYRFEDEVDTNLSDAWLALIIPFPSTDKGWYPDPEKRGIFEPGEEGYRYASEPYVENVAINDSLKCYNIKTLSEKSSDRRTFCETIGFFYFEFINYEQPTGYRIELKGFTVQ